MIWTLHASISLVSSFPSCSFSPTPTTTEHDHGENLGNISSSKILENQQIMQTELEMVNRVWIWFKARLHHVAHK